jgi:hypothetical protein
MVILVAETRSLPSPNAVKYSPELFSLIELMKNARLPAHLTPRQKGVWHGGHEAHQQAGCPNSTADQW